MKKRLGAAIAACALLFGACGQSAAQKQKVAEEKPASSHYPVQVETCGETITFEKAPERIIMMQGTNYSILDALGVNDKIVARVGEVDLNGANDEMQKRIDAIQKLGSSQTESGGAMLSTEAVLEQKADLVVGYTKNGAVDKDALKAAGVNLYVPDSFCENYSVSKASFDLVDKEVDKMAKIFNMENKAQGIKDEAAKRLKNITSPVAKGTTVAGLWVYTAKGELGAYGTSSMAQPIFEANGLKNVFDDQEKRVQVVQIEKLLEKDPEWIVVLGYASQKDALLASVKSFPGADKLQAVKNDKLVFLPFVLTDPPNLLSVDGAIQLSKTLAK